MASSSPFTAQSPVAIIGAGLGGLTLARTLELHKVPYTLYEMDPTSTSRGFQGGSLDMHPASGTRALEIARLTDAFNAKSRPEDDCMVLADGTGKIHHQDDEATSGPAGQRPEIDRGVLRSLLIDSIDGSHIRWGKKVVRVGEAQQDSSTSHTLRTVEFADGSSVTSPLVVGADGAWSKVRPLVSSAKPAYTGVYMVEGHIAEVNRRFPTVAAAVPRGTLMALDHQRGMLSQRNGDGSLRTYATIRVPEDWATSSGLPFDSDPRAAASAILEDLFPSSAGWCDTYRALLSACVEPLDDANKTVPPLVPRPIYALPVDHTWTTTPAVTLIGDASHLMSPFAGEGANLAMLDGARLGEAVGSAHSAGTPLADAIAEFEKEMQERGSEEARGSAENLELFMGPEAARKGAELFKQFAEMAEAQQRGEAEADEGALEKQRAQLPLAENI